jgi:hypothetical protein
VTVLDLHSSSVSNDGAASATREANSLKSIWVREKLVGF